MKAVAERREKMWRSDPRCRQCREPTWLPTGEPTRKGIDYSRMATIEHTISRLNPRRGSPGSWTLVCRECNQKNGDLDMQRWPVPYRDGRMIGVVLVEEEVAFEKRWRRPLDCLEEAR